MNWLKFLTILLTQGPEILKVIVAIVGAFNSLSPEHQDSITNAARQIKLTSS